MEIPLSGGRLTPGVVRVGDTVRRPASESSPFVAALLTHLAAKGFEGAPRHLGWDDRGRDMLTFVPGEVVARWRRLTDEQIATAGRLLRGLHNASRDFADGEVVCHYDPGPNNVVFRDGVPAAFIDFDTAAVGDPLADVAYMAWSWCISSKPERGPAESQARQVRILADAYGLTADQRDRLPAAIDGRFAWNVRFWQEPRPGVTPARAAEIIEWTREQAAFVAGELPAFAAALSAR